MLELVIFLCCIAFAVWWLFWRVDEGAVMRISGAVGLTLVYWAIGIPFGLAALVSIALLLGAWLLPRAST